MSMSESFKDEFMKNVTDAEVIVVDLNVASRKKDEVIILAEYDNKSLDEIEQKFFETPPNKVITYPNHDLKIVDGEEGKTLLIDAPKNGNISDLLSQFPNWEYVVVAITKGELFRKNNPEYKRKIFALFKSGQTFFFKSALLKKAENL